MAQKFLTPIDLTKNELQNARSPNLASAPGTPVAGQVYHDTTTDATYVWNGSAWRPVDAAKLSDGTVPVAALATNPLARANHTGHPAGGDDLRLRRPGTDRRLAQMAAPAAAVNANNQKITGVAAPTAGTDAANKQYVDDMVAAISWKNEVNVATTAAGTLASCFANGPTIDGIALVTGDRILMKDRRPQRKTAFTRSMYSAPRPSPAMPTAAEVSGTAVYVTHGTTNQGTRLVCNAVGTITLGSTAITSRPVRRRLHLHRRQRPDALPERLQCRVGAGTGITVAADSVAIDPAVVVRKYAANIGDGSATAIAVTHSLNTLDTSAEVFTVSDGTRVFCDVTHTSVNVTTFTFAVAPTSNQYRVVIHG